MLGQMLLQCTTAAPMFFHSHFRFREVVDFDEVFINVQLWTQDGQNTSELLLTTRFRNCFVPYCLNTYIQL